MDPFTIATITTGIVKSCYTITANIYTFVDDSNNVDKTVDDLLREIQGLSRGAEAIGSTWTQNPRVSSAQLGTEGNLWGSVQASLEDCQLTLAKLNSKLDELKKGGFFSRGFLRKPTKLVMLNMKIKDIASFKGQIQSYNNAIQSALLMINVCLMLNSNSSQESMSHVLIGLKTQIGRVENALHGQLQSGNVAPELAADNDRMTQNLRTLIRNAESLHSSASTVVGDARSTVWEGSVLGEPLSEEQFDTIRNWIPPPIIEEEENIQGSGPPGSGFMDSALREEDKESDADSNIERDLLSRYRDIALSNLEQKDYGRAESFYRKVIEMSADAEVSDTDKQDMTIMLAFSCALQDKWGEAGTIFPSIAFAKGAHNLLSFHGLYALSMACAKKGDFVTASKYCKRAVGGYRKLLGKSDPHYYEAMAMLAQFYFSNDDIVSSEGCRTFLPAAYPLKIDIEPQKFLESHIFKDSNTEEAQSRLLSTLPIPTMSRAEGEPSSQNQGFQAQAGTSNSTLQLPSQTVNSSKEAPRSATNDSMTSETNSNPSFRGRVRPLAPKNGEDDVTEAMDNMNIGSGPISPSIVAKTANVSNEDKILPFLKPATVSKTQKNALAVANSADTGWGLGGSSLLPQPRTPARLIIAVDFGTTESAVAWAFVGNDGVKEDMLTNWPGTGNLSKPTVPTVLYYNQVQKVLGWGYDIADALAPTGFPKPGVMKVEWFKLQLMPFAGNHLGPINLPPLPPGKSEIDVSADYLFKLRQAIRAELSIALGEVFFREERSIHYCFSVPSVWSDGSKTATRAAIIQAGYLRDENDNRLDLVTEAEAAALYCLKTSVFTISVKGIVLVVDCNGSTVDLQAFQLESESPRAFSNFIAGSGDLSGSTAVNRNFSNILRFKILRMRLPEGYKTPGRVYARCIMDFERRIRDDFRNNGQKWAVDVGIEAEYPDASIEEGYMTFTNEEILQCFEPVVNRILELIQNQIIAVQARNSTLQSILVTGPFGGNEYVFQQIKLACPPELQSKVVRPLDSVGIVVKGTLTAGIEHYLSILDTPVPLDLPPCQFYKATQTYLLQIPVQTNSSYHEEKIYCYGSHDPDGTDRLYDCAVSFLSKGQRLDSFKTIHFPVVQFFKDFQERGLFKSAQTDPRYFSHGIYTSDYPIEQGQRLIANSCHDISQSVSVNLKSKGVDQFRKFRTQRGESLYMAEYEIMLEGGPPPELIIRIIHGGVEIGSWPFKPKCEML